MFFFISVLTLLDIASAYVFWYINELLQLDISGNKWKIMHLTWSIVIEHSAVSVTHNGKVAAIETVRFDEIWNLNGASQLVVDVNAFQAHKLQV